MSFAASTHTSVPLRSFFRISKSAVIRAVLSARTKNTEREIDAADIIFMRPSQDAREQLDTCGKLKESELSARETNVVTVP
jgi:hypothetical protein